VVLIGVWLYSVLLAWVLTNALLGAAITSTNDKATDAGANKAVSGYMTFLLYSVAGLACELFFSIYERLVLTIIHSCSLCWIIGVHDHSSLCWRVSGCTKSRLVGFSIFFSSNTQHDTTRTVDDLFSA